MITKLYNVYIDFDHVIGIGPLMKSVKPNSPEFVLYKVCVISFDLFTIAGSIKVSTDELAFTNTDDKKKNDAEYNDIKNAHADAVKWLHAREMNGAINS